MARKKRLTAKNAKQLQRYAKATGNLKVEL
jgi:hypothetical protein